METLKPPKPNDSPTFLDKLLKFGFVVIICLVFIFVLLSFFKMGMVFWVYDRVFSWVTARLGADYYLAQFISLSLTAIFSAMYPYLLWSFFVGRYRIPTTIAVVAGSGIMCILVYTAGSEVFFDRSTGQPLKWYADTPDGRTYSNTPGYDKKFGIQLRPFTPVIALRDAEIKKKAEEAAKREAEQKAALAADMARKKAEEEQRKAEEAAKAAEIEKMARERRLVEKGGVQVTPETGAQPPMAEPIRPLKPQTRRITQSFVAEDISSGDNAPLGIDSSFLAPRNRVVYVCRYENAAYNSAIIVELYENGRKTNDFCKFATPGGQGRYSCIFNRKFDPGQYMVRVLENGENLDELQFSVKAPAYAAPPASPVYTIPEPRPIRRRWVDVPGRWMDGRWVQPHREWR